MISILDTRYRRHADARESRKLSLGHSAECSSLLQCDYTILNRNTQTYQLLVLERHDSCMKILKHIYAQNTIPGTDVPGIETSHRTIVRWRQVRCRTPGRYLLECSARGWTRHRPSQLESPDDAYRRLSFLEHPASNQRSRR